MEKDSYLMDFAKNLKMLREEKGLSLRDVAKDTGISKSALSQYEKCLNDPGLGKVKKLAEYFEEDFEWLIGNQEYRRIKKMA